MRLFSAGLCPASITLLYSNALGFFSSFRNLRALRPAAAEGRVAFPPDLRARARSVRPGAAARAPRAAARRARAHATPRFCAALAAALPLHVVATGAAADRRRRARPPRLRLGTGPGLRPPWREAPRGAEAGAQRARGHGAARAFALTAPSALAALPRPALPRREPLPAPRVRDWHLGTRGRARCGGLANKEMGGGRSTQPAARRRAARSGGSSPRRCSARWFTSQMPAGGGMGVAWAAVSAEQGWAGAVGGGQAGAGRVPSGGLGAWCSGTEAWPCWRRKAA